MEGHIWRSGFSVVIICLCSGFVHMYFMFVVNNLFVAADKWFLSLPNHNQTTFLHQWGLVVSALWLGSFFCAPVAVLFADKFGRKRTLIIACVLWLIGACFICLVYPTKQLILAMVGRFFTGFGNGLSMNVGLLWIGELSPRNLRGFFVSFMAASGGLGCIVGVIIPLPDILGRPDYWILALALGNLVGIVLLPVISYLPESPRFLFYTKGLSNETLKSIEFYHGSQNLHSLLEELQAEQEISKLSLRDVMSDRRFKKSLILCTLLTGFICLTGFIYIIQYSSAISQAAGLSDFWALYTTTLLAAIKFVCSFAVPWVVGHFKRRTLIQSGLYMSAVCNILIALILAFIPQSTQAGTAVVVVMIIFVPINTVLFAIKYVCAVELCTQEIRAICLVCGRAIGNILETIVTYPFLPLSAAIGMWPVFVFSAISTIVMAMYFHKELPETKNSTFLETAENLAISADEERRPLLRRSSSESELTEEIF